MKRLTVAVARRLAGNRSETEATPTLHRQPRTTALGLDVLQRRPVRIVLTVAAADGVASSQQQQRGAHRGLRNPQA